MVRVAEIGVTVAEGDGAHKVWGTLERTADRVRQKIQEDMRLNGTPCEYTVTVERLTDETNG